LGVGGRSLVLDLVLLVAATAGAWEVLALGASLQSFTHQLARLTVVVAHVPDAVDEDVHGVAVVLVETGAHVLLGQQRVARFHCRRLVLATLEHALRNLARGVADVEFAVEYIVDNCEEVLG